MLTCPIITTPEEMDAIEDALESMDAGIDVYADTHYKNESEDLARIWYHLTTSQQEQLVAAFIAARLER